MKKIQIQMTKKYFIEIDEQKILDFVEKEKQNPVDYDLEDFYNNLDFEYVSTTIINYKTKEHIIHF